MLRASKLPSFGVLLGLNLVCLDFDGESAVDYAGDQNINFTDATWTIKDLVIKVF